MQLEDTPNWVEKRVQCRMKNIFAELAKIVQRDVEEMNKQVDRVAKEEIPGREMRLCPFVLDQEQLPTTVLVRTSTNRYLYQNLAVAFEFDLNKDSIHVEVPKVENGQQTGWENLFTIETLQWHAKQQTYLPCIDGEPYQIWEVSQKALGPLFFLVPTQAPPKVHVTANSGPPPE
ncbi:MAG: hypothetical protein OXC18_18450 [Desulfurellaceae bacterium]|nr:hypothetical protein [Desulfurellaceae bacterium]